MYRAVIIIIIIIVVVVVVVLNETNLAVRHSVVARAGDVGE